MRYVITQILFSLLLLQCLVYGEDSCESSEDSCEDDLFPEDFIFGAATSSYQIEGGWNASGKGVSIWDHLTHTRPEAIDDRSNGDVAADSFTFYKKDVEALKYLGAHFYRFSISWPRILPTGDISSINEEGIQYYSDLIDSLLSEGIQPMVTMFHWDLPQALQDLGGFTNPLIVDYFEQYARILFDRLGDRVNYWITFNEPYIQCIGGYLVKNLAPLLYSPGVGEYLCGHHILVAHARAYHLYQNEFKEKYNAKVGITLVSHGFFAKTNTTADEEARIRALQFMFGWFAHPIFSKVGGYPPMMVETIDRNSEQEGRAWSRLPRIDCDLRKQLLGTSDFMGLNHYTTYLVTPKYDHVPPPSWESDQEVDTSTDPSWEQGASVWLFVVPDGFRDLLNWIKDEYDNPPLYITENGFSDRGESIQDVGRSNYITSYLSATLRAIREDGCNIKGYFAWALIDTFEWLRGYTEIFGMFKVDFNSPLKPRSPKMSADVYKEIIKTRKIQESK